MAGFVEEVLQIDECLRIVSEALAFPWGDIVVSRSLNDALFARAADSLIASEQVPPFTRSLRDGYALGHTNTAGASQSAPVFLRLAGEVNMAEAPDFYIDGDTCAAIPTGGMLPEGADAVVMLEDTAEAGGWIEIRRAVQRGENLIFAGEDIAADRKILKRGEQITPPLMGLLATLGVTALQVANPRIGIISTGDEIVPIGTNPLPYGFIRDANAHIVRSILKRYGFDSEFYGIAKDCGEVLAVAVQETLASCDVVLLSGGSSVGIRDHATRVMESVGLPGLITRGVNMSPGKPTLVGGNREERKLLVGLPGHPLSCMVAEIFVVLPLLLRMIGAEETRSGRTLKMTLGSDVAGRTGPEEFIPMRMDANCVYPLAAKSGYVSALMDGDGFIRMDANVETLRKGEETEVWTW